MCWGLAGVMYQSQTFQKVFGDQEVPFGATRSAIHFMCCKWRHVSAGVTVFWE